MRIVGKVIETKIRKGTSKTGREWQSKQFVVEYVDGNFTKQVAFELFGENAINQNQFKKGQNVAVDFSVESREYNGNWYTSCNAYRVQTGEAAKGSGEQNPEFTSLHNTAQLDDTSALPF